MRCELALHKTSLPVQIQALEPAVYIYCQNPLTEDSTPLQPLLMWGGEIKRTENLGRESHAFLLHILQHYHALPDLVLFSQDEPEEHLMRMRIEVRKDQRIAVTLITYNPYLCYARHKGPFSACNLYKLSGSCEFITGKILHCASSTLSSYLIAAHEN